jgi:hypothetical protein
MPVDSLRHAFGQRLHYTLAKNGVFCGGGLWPPILISNTLRRSERAPLQQTTTNWELRGVSNDVVL